MIITEELYRQQLGMVLDEAVYFEHFGVKGMQWGKRNSDKGSSGGNSSTDKKAKFEKKAKKYDARAKDAQTVIDRIDSKISSTKDGHRKNKLKAIREDVIKQKEIAVKDAEAKRQGKLSSGQKKALIGAGVAGTILAAYGARNLVSSGEMHRKVMNGKEFMKRNTTTKVNWDFDPNTGQVPKFKVNRKLAKFDMDEDAIMSNVVSRINPDYGAPGTVVNCRRATFAYEMSRRGYDVAATKTTTGRGQTMVGNYNALNPDGDIARTGITSVVTRTVGEHIKKQTGLIDSTPFSDFVTKQGTWGENPIVVTPGARSHAEAIFKALSKQPDRSRGEVGVEWKVGGGHSIAYEVIKGKAILFDTQSGKKMGDWKEFTDTYEGIGVAEAAFTRLDNAKLNQDFLQRWVKNA